MLRVIVEVHPYGVSDVKRTLATIDLANITALEPCSDYRYEATLDDGRRIGGVVAKHPRSSGWAPLVRRVMYQLAGKMAAPIRGKDQP